MNPFESGVRKVIPAVLIYVKSGDRILMVHRNAIDRPGDYHTGKWNGLGGKCELDESPLQAAKRELSEESCLDLPESAFKPLGVLQFPNFKAHKQEDWIVYVFVADVPPTASEYILACPEGELHWVAQKDLLSLNLWPGDKHFIPLVTERKPFMGTIWYQGPDVVNYWVTAF